jgi:7-cyano-7-deazaguanine reductase
MKKRNEAENVSRKDQVEELTLLGAGKTVYPSAVSASILETFPNRYPERPYRVIFASEEFTSLCPVTGQPDFGKITIEYAPAERCIESKSLKLYLFSYRNEQTFMETLTNRILEDCVAACQPRGMLVIGDFKARGGITIRVEAEYEADQT